MLTRIFLIHELFIKKKTQIFNVLWEIILLISNIKAEKMKLFPQINKKSVKKNNCSTMALRNFFKKLTCKKNLKDDYFKIVIQKTMLKIFSKMPTIAFMKTDFFYFFLSFFLSFFKIPINSVRFSGYLLFNKACEYIGLNSNFCALEIIFWRAFLKKSFIQMRRKIYKESTEETRICNLVLFLFLFNKRPFVTRPLNARFFLPVFKNTSTKEQNFKNKKLKKKDICLSCSQQLKTHYHNFLEEKLTCFLSLCALMSNTTLNKLLMNQKNRKTVYLEFYLLRNFRYALYQVIRVNLIYYTKKLVNAKTLLTFSEVFGFVDLGIMMTMVSIFYDTHHFFKICHGKNKEKEIYEVLYLMECYVKQKKKKSVLLWKKFNLKRDLSRKLSCYFLLTFWKVVSLYNCEYSVINSIIMNVFFADQHSSFSWKYARKQSTVAKKNQTNSYSNDKARVDANMKHKYGSNIDDDNQIKKSFFFLFLNKLGYIFLLNANNSVEKANIASRKWDATKLFDVLKSGSGFQKFRFNIFVTSCSNNNKSVPQYTRFAVILLEISKVFKKSLLLQNNCLFSWKWRERMYCVRLKNFLLLYLIGCDYIIKSQKQTIFYFHGLCFAKLIRFFGENNFAIQNIDFLKSTLPCFLFFLKILIHHSFLPRKTTSFMITTNLDKVYSTCVNKIYDVVTTCFLNLMLFKKQNIGLLFIPNIILIKLINCKSKLIFVQKKIKLNKELLTFFAKLFCFAKKNLTGKKKKFSKHETFINFNVDIEISMLSMFNCEEKKINNGAKNTWPPSALSVRFFLEKFKNNVPDKTSLSNFGFFLSIKNYLFKKRIYSHKNYQKRIK